MAKEITTEKAISKSMKAWRQWQLWVHYFILGTFIWLYVWFAPNFLTTEGYVWFLFFVVVLDQLIHFFLRVLTGWDD